MMTTGPWPSPPGVEVGAATGNERISVPGSNTLLGPGIGEFIPCPGWRVDDGAAESLSTVPGI